MDDSQEQAIPFLIYDQQSKGKLIHTLIRKVFAISKI